MKVPAHDRTVAFGIIPGQDVRPGDHIAYFWEAADEFDRGVQFLVAGLAGADHCVVFGHDDANERVLEVLRLQGVDVDRVQRQGRLTVAGSASTGDATLANLGSIFQAAVDAGAPMIRLLGNIGWGKPGWPDEDDLLLFEAKVTSAAKAFPAVVVCMYDVQTLSGRVIVNGGVATHGISVCGNMMRVNPYPATVEATASRIRETSRRGPFDGRPRQA